MTAFWIALLVAGLTAAPIYKGLLAIKSRQTVSVHVQEHAHKQGTPTMGGLIVMVGVLAGLLPFAFSDRTQILLAALVLALGFGLLGFVDDYVIPKVMVGKRGLGWTPKLLGQIVFAVIAGFMVAPIGPALGLCIFLVLFFSNAYNFADGLDALAGSILLAFLAGSVTITAILVAPRDPQAASALWTISGVLAGGAIPFLFLNAPPAKMFMGDVGALPIGALLGLLTFVQIAPYSAPLSQPTIWMGLIVLSGMMFIELVPVPMQIFWVKVFKKRIFPFTPIHHAFQRAGWPETRVVWMFFLAQIVFSAGAATIIASAMGNSK
jgi:phospho-N-acetylmuramoyl-pentapeptide-transferase